TGWSRTRDTPACRRGYHQVSWDEAGSGADVAGGQRDHVPDAALAVTGHRQRLGVVEQVQREAVVGDLLAAAGPRDQAELGGEDVGGTGLGSSRGRYPGRGA